MRRWTCPLAATGCALVVLATPVSPRAQAAADAATYHETIPGTLVEFEMVLVPGGPVEVPGPDGPATVDVAEFHLGRTEVTWDMYDVFALGLDQGGGDTPADAIARPSHPYGAPDYGWGHAGFPVMSVTRQAAETFADWLAKKTGRSYRLPTEAEWLRAASAASGERPPSPDRLDALAWYRPNAGRRTHAVASRELDAVGLFDLFGNVAEWVMTADGTLVTRGGSFRDADVGPGARAVQDSRWNETDPQLPKSRWWLSDAPFVGFRLAVTNPR